MHAHTHKHTGRQTDKIDKAGRQTDTPTKSKEISLIRKPTLGNFQCHTLVRIDLTIENSSCSWMESKHLLMSVFTKYRHLHNQFNVQ